MPQKSARLDAANNYAVLTCCSATVLLPVSLAFEGTGAFEEMRRLITTTSDASGLLRRMVVCGALYYSYNEVSSLSLRGKSRTPGCARKGVNTRARARADGLSSARSPEPGITGGDEFCQGEKSPSSVPLRDSRLLIP